MTCRSCKGVQGGAQGGWVRQTAGQTTCRACPIASRAQGGRARHATGQWRAGTARKGICHPVLCALPFVVVFGPSRWQGRGGCGQSAEPRHTRHPVLQHTHRQCASSQAGFTVLLSPSNSTHLQLQPPLLPGQSRGGQVGHPGHVPLPQGRIQRRGVPLPQAVLLAHPPPAQHTKAGERRASRSGGVCCCQCCSSGLEAQC